MGILLSITHQILIQTKIFLMRFSKLSAVALVLLSSSSAYGQQLFNRDDGVFAAPNAADMAFTASGAGAIQRTIDAHIKDGAVSVKDFGASGSATATTGNITAGTTTLTLAGAIDFQNAQGIRINHAGTPYALNPPTGLTVTNAGTPGTTTYTYTVSCFDSNGGIDAALTTVETTTGAATLSTTNYNTVTWVAPAGTAPAGCAVWGRTSGSLALLALLPDTATSWDDYGYGSLTAPGWLGSTPPATQAADWLVTTISSGAGTTALTLAAPASTTATAQTTAHDDTLAFNNAIGSVWPAGGQVMAPQGTYNLSSTIRIGASPVKFKGSGWGNTKLINYSADSSYFTQPTTGGYITIADVSMTSPFIRTGGSGFDITGGAYIDIHDIYTDGMFYGFSNHGNAVFINNIDMRNTAPYYGVGVRVLGHDQYMTNIIMDSTYTTRQPRACVEYKTSGGVMLRQSDFIHCGVGLLIDPEDGEIVQWGSIHGVSFDTSSGDGIYINPTGTGQVFGINFTQVWTATFEGYGLHVGATGSTMGLKFIGHRFLNNTKAGVLLEAGEDIAIQNSHISGNSRVTSGAYSGVEFRDVTNLTLDGNRIGNTMNYTKRQKYGIWQPAGYTATNGIIANNDVHENITQGIKFEGTFTGKQVLGNLPVTGEMSVTFGGSVTVAEALAVDGMHSTGTEPTPSGTCAITTQVGGNTAGRFTANGACVSGTVILTFAHTPAHGYACDTANQTTPANLMTQTASTTSTVTLTGNMTGGDVVVFKCIGY
jgi:hypothetical protein